jgi:hypothetical protein
MTEQSAARHLPPGVYHVELLLPKCTWCMQTCVPYSPWFIRESSERVAGVVISILLELSWNKWVGTYRKPFRVQLSSPSPLACSCFRHKSGSEVMAVWLWQHKDEWDAEPKHHCGLCPGQQGGSVGQSPQSWQPNTHPVPKEKQLTPHSGETQPSEEHWC